MASGNFGLDFRINYYFYMENNLNFLFYILNNILL